MIINDTYKLTATDLNFIIEKKQITQEHAKTNPENIGAIKWVTNGYYSSFPNIVTALENKEDVLSSEIENLLKLRDDVLSVIDDFKSILDTDIESYKKITLNKDWQIVGKYSNYQLIRRTTIQAHRFVKEENIGKDKFVSEGFAPNISIALKTILNIELLHALENQDITIDELRTVINSLVKDSGALHFEAANEEDLNTQYNESDDELVTDESLDEE